MKTETLAAKDWDDLVFENRHKEYGAYEVRKAYSGNLVAGFSVSMGIALLAFIIPILFFLIRGDVAGPIKDLPPLGDIIEIVQPPSIELPKIQPPPSAPAQQVQTTALTPVVTTAQVEPVDIAPNDQMVVGNTTDPVVGTPGEGTATGTGSGTVPTAVPAVVAPPQVLDIAEVMPAFEGGLEEMYKFIRKKIHYPAASRRIGVEGTVYVSFVVNREGKVVDVKTIRGISPDCDKEAERVVSMLPNWSPGMQNHNPVSVRMTVPIKFQLDK
ncbi:energy transducer TonB [Ohtaekwangia kribbensis]|jgi:protein TonB|uniref:Energy transducer TonB n=1 Tax=Ohtaekwangia kribbensis TaxID=688913 RepID=A0ABW3K6P8_9BACT